MADAESSRVAPKLVWIGLLLLGLILGLQTVRMRVAEAAVRSDNGALAASIRPQNGWGLALLAESRFRQGDTNAAAGISRQAISRTPLAVVALRTLARAQDKLRGPGGGEKAWQAASLLGWRDKQTQLWAALRALSNREADVFAMRADALLRTGDPDEMMTRFIRQAVIEPEIRRAFVARLAEEPPWRSRFLLAEKPPSGRELEGVVLVLRDLGRTDTPPKRSELRNALLGLIAAGRYSEAAALDRRFVRRLPDPGSLLDDGRFDLADTDYLTKATPFDWSLDARKASIDQSGGGRMVAVFGASGDSGPAVIRYVELSPGQYRLTFRMRGAPKAGSGIIFASQCAASQTVLASSARTPLSSGDWESRSFDFTVPAGCGLVRLTIDAVQPDAPDALIDDVLLRRI